MPSWYEERKAAEQLANRRAQLVILALAALALSVWAARELLG